MWIKPKNLENLNNNIREGLLDIKAEILELKKDIYKKEKYPILDTNFLGLSKKTKEILKSILKFKSEGKTTKQIKEILVNNNKCCRDSFYNNLKIIKYYPFIKSLYEETPRENIKSIKGDIK